MNAATNKYSLRKKEWPAKARSAINVTFDWYHLAQAEAEHCATPGPRPARVRTDHYRARLRRHGSRYQSVR